MSSSDDKEIYDVDEILEKRIRKGITEYKIKWEGYSIHQATWEPLSNLANVQDMIDEFEEKYDEAKAKLINKKRTREVDPENHKYSSCNSDDSSVINKPAMTHKDRKYLNTLKDIIIKKVITVNKIHNVLHAQILYDDKGRNKKAWVPTSLMKKTAPEMLIDFYEDKICFS